MLDRRSIKQKTGIILLVASSLGLVAGALVLARGTLSPAVAQPSQIPPAPPGDGAVGLVFPAAAEGSPVVDAYRQVLSEEGFQLRPLTPDAAAEMTPAEMHRRLAAVVLPEEVNRRIAPALANSLVRFVREEGGALWLGQDVGRDETGQDRAGWGSDLLHLAGVEYAKGAGARTAWSIPLDSPLRRHFDPQVFQGDLLKLYAYPPFQEQRVPVQVTGGRVLAMGAPLRVPVAVEREHRSGGTAFYLNARPARSKLANDDLLLRTPLKYFLLEKARAPRLVASPDGIGGLALSVHICAGTYNRDLDHLLAHNAFLPEVPISFSITAGPDNNRPGDGTGFDAENPRRGGAYIKRLQGFGSVGSQGGWIHNYWAANVARLAPEQRQRWIRRNFEALRRATGRPVTEYSAPGGAHTTDLNDYLAAEGTRIASIPTSYNAPPTHAWFGGRREDRFWLLGYSATQYGPAVENMLAQGRSPDEIAADVAGLFEVAARKREIRLFYSHPFELATRPEMWRSIQDAALGLVREGRLNVRTMGDFARFLDRREKTVFEITNLGGAYLISASNPESLRSLTFALPVPLKRLPATPGGEAGPRPLVRLSGEKGWSYVTVVADVKRLELRLPYSSSRTAVGIDGGPSFTRSSRRTN